MSFFTSRKKLFLISCFSLLIGFNSSAQIGKQLSVGIVLPSTGKTEIEVTGKTGFEISYHVFAKYSDKLEWMSGFGYINAPYEFASYREDNDFNTSKYFYTASKEASTMHLLNYDYSLSYFIVPDMLAICGGANIGFAFGGFSDTRTSTGDRILYSKIDLTKFSGSSGGVNTLNNPAIYNSSDAGIEDAFYKMFNYGFHIGANFTYNERYKIYAMYNIGMNQLLGESAFSEFVGVPKARLLRIGLSYKFIPSYKKLRF